MNFSAIPTNLSSKTTKIGLIIQNAVAALLPPDGSAGSGHREEFPLGAVSGR